MNKGWIFIFMFAIANKIHFYWIIMYVILCKELKKIVHQKMVQPNDFFAQPLFIQKELYH